MWEGQPGIQVVFFFQAMKNGKKIIMNIMLTGSIDASFLVYEPNSFPVEKKK